MTLVNRDLMVSCIDAQIRDIRAGNSTTKYILGAGINDDRVSLDTEQLRRVRDFLLSFNEE